MAALTGLASSWNLSCSRIVNCGHFCISGLLQLPVDTCPLQFLLSWSVHQILQWPHWSYQVSTENVAGYLRKSALPFLGLVLWVHQQSLCECIALVVESVTHCAICPKTLLGLDWDLVRPCKSWWLTVKSSSPLAPPVTCPSGKLKVRYPVKKCDRVSGSSRSSLLSTKESHRFW